MTPTTPTRAEQVVFRSEAMLRPRREVKENLPVYVHRRVYNALREVVSSADLEPGDKMPSHAQLAGFLHIGSPTIRRAMGQLAEEGLIAIIPGQGTFIL